MSNASHLIFCYDGELMIGDDFMSIYVGGRNRPLRIMDNMTLSQLQSRILRSLQYDCIEYFGGFMRYYQISTNKNKLKQIIIKLDRKFRRYLDLNLISS